MALRTGKEVTDEAVMTLARLQSGEIEPITTGTPHLDEALLGGLLPGTVLGIVARSMHGKTYELEKIDRHVKKTYPDDVVILQCAWELEVLKLITRDIAYQTKKSTKEVMFQPPEGADLEVFKKVCDSFRNENLYFQNEPVSSEEFEDDIMKLIDTYPDKRILVTIDNLENVLDTESSQKASMDRLLYTINILKKRHSFISFIILNQANNELTKRVGDPKAHKPMESDIYGTDQLLKLCDVVLFKVIPTKLGIFDKYMVFGKDRYHWLDEFKLPSGGSTTSFDPFGCVFFFYLKLRQVENEKDVRDLHITRMYTREDCGLRPVTHTTKPEFPVGVGESRLPIVDFSENRLNDLSKSSAVGQGFTDDEVRGEDNNVEKPF